MLLVSAEGIIGMLGVVAAVAVFAHLAPSHAAAPLPDPTIDATLSTATGIQTAFGGGSFRRSTSVTRFD